MINLDEILLQFHLDMESYDMNLTGEDFRKSRDRAYRLAGADIKHLVADYIESIELPKKQNLNKARQTGLKALTDFSYNIGVAVGIADSQAKLDEAIKALKENK